MVSSAMPNAHMSDVILTPTSGVEVSSDDPRMELNSHGNIVVLGSKSFVFESTGRTYNVKYLSSDLGISKHIPIVSGA